MLWEVVQTAPQETSEREKTNSRAKWKCFAKDGNYQTENVGCWCLSFSPDQSSACRFVHKKRDSERIHLYSGVSSNAEAQIWSTYHISLVLWHLCQVLSLWALRNNQCLTSKLWDCCFSDPVRRCQNKSSIWREINEVVFAHFISEKSTEGPPEEWEHKGLVSSLGK